MRHRSKDALSLKTTDAMIVCDVDRQKFNEAISRGYYRNAPETIPGKSRDFTEPDLFQLYIFGLCLKSYTLEMSAQTASAVRETYYGHLRAKFIEVTSRWVWHDGPPPGEEPAAMTMRFDPALILRSLHERIEGLANE